jgi:hypothetical protein
MKAMKLLLTIGAAALFAVAGSRTAKADAWDQATKLTFSGPVEVPGLALPAGTYWFTLADSDSDRNIVQVWNEDRTQLLKTILAIPDYPDRVKAFSCRPTPHFVFAWMRH